MKSTSFKIPLCFILLLIGALPTFSQTKSIPDHRFAIRCNTLGLFNLSAVVELEYSISARIGLFLGGGIGVQDAYPTGFIVFKNRENDYCKISGYGSYLGTRVGIPIGKLQGLAVKAIVQYDYYHAEGVDCIPNIHSQPFPNPYITNTISTALCVAYTQPFAKRFFVEPLVGFGPYWSSTAGKREITHQYWKTAVQLNLGVRL